MNCGRIHVPSFTRALCLGIPFYFFCIAISVANDISGTYRYQGFATNGNVVVVGLATLRAGVATKVTGTWKLQILDRDKFQELGPQNGFGKMNGRLDSDSLFLNLNSGEFGDNIYLKGKVTRGNGVKIKGKWVRYGYYQGRMIEGDFEMVAVQNPRKKN